MTDDRWSGRGDTVLLNPEEEFLKRRTSQADSIEPQEVFG